jgi:peptidoglycan hydrolase CwlO-like protein
MKRIVSLMTLAIVLTATSAMADKHEGGGAGKGQHVGKDPTAAPGVEKRVGRQKAKIARKLEKGKITQEQAAQLNQKVDAVETKKAELSADGKLTKEERKELRQELNKTKEEIKAVGAKVEKPKVPSVPSAPSGN